MNNTEQQNQSKKHRWYDVIVAWANGDTVQSRPLNRREDWKDYNCNNVANDTPVFYNGSYEWRIKPKTITKRYRMAIVNTSERYKVIAVETTYSTIDDPAEYNVDGFIRWIGDSVEVEIGV